MRYRLAALMLFAVLPVMNALAAPAPDPSAILDIGPPRKGWSREKHLESEIDHLTSPYGYLFAVWLNPEISRLPSVAAFKDPRSWLSKNLRVTKEDGGRCLRLTFRAGSRREQVAILNTLLRVYIQLQKKTQKEQEVRLSWDEDDIRELKKRIASEQSREYIERYRTAIEDTRSIHIPARRTEIERYKQIAVIKWAK